MTSPTPPARGSRGIVALVLGTAVFLSTMLIAASWSIRSEAHDRDDDHGKHGSSYSFGTDEDFSYALVGSKSTTMSGASVQDIERLKDRYDGDFLWVSIEGRRYVIVDDDVVDKARDIVAPMNELGERQGRLGAEQSRLGARQAAIGARQASIGVRQAALSTRLAALAVAGMDGSKRDDLDEELHELGVRMDELARLQEPLARQQDALGRRQSELGRQMERLSARVEEEMRHLAENAVANHQAERVRD